MSDYEHIVISAVRYALGRMTYIVKTTVDYVIKDMEEGKLSEKALWIIRIDVQQYEKNLGMECDTNEWRKLQEKINEVLGGDN